MSYGLSHAGYDVRIKQDLELPAGQFALCSTMERFALPATVKATVCDKSSWARQGLAVQNTRLEPGWEGWLTLELTNHGPERLIIPAGAPIAQIEFVWLDHATDKPYDSGKYQNQPDRPVKALRERP